MPSSLIAIGTAVSEWWAGTSLATVASYAARTLLTIGLTKLIANKAGDTGAGTSGTGGGRVQLSPATDNILPVVYGSAFVAPMLTDAKISSDNETMWYVCALSEVTDTGSFSFDNLYYDGKLATFDTTDRTKVVSLTTNANPAQEDTSCAGSLFIYAYSNGSNSPVNTTLTAIEVLQDAAIPVDYRWTSTDLMSSTAFLIVKIVYNQNSGLTNLGQLQVKLTNSLSKPGDVINDYLQNSRYGCAVPASQIDSASITALNTYSDELIPYTLSGSSYTQARYRINGVVNTGTNCMNNLQQLVDGCDSWMQYNELSGKWRIVINQSYEQQGLTLADLFAINSSNLIGGIQLQPLDLNNTYNQMEIQYPNVNVRDQTNFINLDLRNTPEAALMSPNEPVNKLTVQLANVNNYVQAYYLGVRRLLQSREDLTITCSLDYSGIQIEAGDIVKITLEQYGWTDKLFRVSQVQEVKDVSGSLGANITAFEYNSTIYTNDAIDDFIPADNTGLTDPNILSSPGQPTVATSNLLAGNNASFVVTTTIPTSGQTLFLDFDFGTTNIVSDHKLYRTISPTTSQQFTPGSTLTITVNDLPAGTYYWSAKARNNSQGKSSISSSGYVWSGMNITDYTSVIKANASSSGNVIYVDTSSVIAGQQVQVTGGSGALAAGATVLAVLGAGSLLLNSLPSSPLVDAALKIFGGGAKNKNVADGAITASKMAPNSGVGPVYWVYYDPDLTTGAIDSASSTTARNISLSYPGYDPTPDDIFPWAQGTSSTANGYLDNSTAPFLPYTASFQHFNEGDSGWYKIAKCDITGDPFTNGDIIQENGLFTFIIDTAPAKIQICSYFYTAAMGISGYKGQVLTPQLQTFIIPEVGPYPFSATYNVASSYFGVDPTVELGVVVRNLTPGANVSCIMGTYSAKQNNG